MGFMTLRDFREEVNFSLGDKAQSSNIPLDRWVNRAYFEVVGRMAADLPDFQSVEVITTTACDPSYTVPAASGRRFLSILSVADLTNKRRILYTAPRNFMLKDQDICATPEVYTRQAGSLLLWPAPRSPITLQVLGVLEPLPLSAPADTTTLPSALDHPVLLLAQRNAYLSLRMKDDATLNHQAAGQYLQTWQTEAQLSDGSPSVGVQIAESWEDLTEMRGDMMGEG